MQATVESDVALFALGDDLPVLERQLATLHGPARLAPLVALAWYLHETHVEGALALAEKLRLAVHALVFEGIGSQSISVGVAQCRAAENVTETLARADAALYRAKHGGRNRVELG